MNLDRYTFSARLIPVYTVLIPVGIAFAVIYPGSSLLQLGGAITIFPAALATLASQLGRDKGSLKQPSLWESWGGPPTTQLLRHGNARVGAEVRQRYHNIMSQLRPDLQLPTPEQEVRDPSGADHVYEECTRFLINETRDTKAFPLVFKENVNYGYRRNMWGLKPIGILASLTGVMTVAAKMVSYWPSLATAPAELTVGGGLSLAMLLVWCFWVTPPWVRIAAQAYADRLYEASETLLRMKKAKV